METKIEKVIFKGIECWKVKDNYFTCSKYSEERAIILGNGLWHCKECLDCISCYMCKNCIECDRCQYCDDSNYCDDSCFLNKCSNCRDSFFCYKCEHLNVCVKCSWLSFSDHCIGVKKDYRLSFMIKEKVNFCIK